MAEALRRLALVNRHFHLSGSFERTTVLVARALVRQGIDVHCYCDPATRTAEAEGVVFHDVDPGVRSANRLVGGAERAGFAREATRALRRDRAMFDLVDVTGTAAWEHDVLNVHEVVEEAARRWPREGGRGFRAAALRARLAPLLQPRFGVDCVIQRLQLRPGAYVRLVVPTTQVRDDLLELYDVSPEEIDLIPPPLDLTPFTVANGSRTTVRRELGIGADDRVLLFVGHSFARKGLGLAIHALVGLPDDVQLVVVGEGDGETEGFRREASRAGVDRRVRFVGRTVDTARYYHAADAFVLPTKHEVWGIALIEAMAAGLPVVTTSAAGGASAVAETGTGILLDDPDAEELRASLATLLDRPDLRAEMAARGPAAAARWDIEAHVAARLETYGKALAMPKSRGRRRVAALPSVQRMNPYQELLYAGLRERGFPLDRGTKLSLRSLLRGRRGVAVLHVHWPEHLYTFARGPRPLHTPLSWVKLGLFTSRLVGARVLGYRIVWTVHQVYPHGPAPGLRERVGARVLTRASDALIVHDTATAQRARASLGRSLPPLARIPHGSYVGVYPPGRGREEVRDALGVPREAFCFLCFGELRATKSLDLVIGAFADTDLSEAVLVVAGMARAPELADRLRALAAADPRIRLRLRYVPDDEVAELFGACDAAVVARDDGGTSGSLVLPLSLGVPVVVADRPAYLELLGGVDCCWTYRAGDRDSLRAALERAAADPQAARDRGTRAIERARALDWRDVAAATARVFEDALRRRRL